MLCLWASPPAHPTRSRHASKTTSPPSISYHASNLPPPGRNSPCFRRATDQHYFGVDPMEIRAARHRRNGNRGGDRADFPVLSVDATSLSAAQQCDETYRRFNVRGEGRTALGLFEILAPGLDLKTFVELRGGKGGGSIEAPFVQRQRNDQRAACRGRRM